MLVELLTKDDFHKFKQELLRDLAGILQVDPALLPEVETEFEKIIFSVSVAELALLLRVAIDAGIIDNENKTAMARCVALFIRTN